MFFRIFSSSRNASFSFPGQVAPEQAAGAVLIAGKRGAFRGFQANYLDMDGTGHACTLGSGDYF